ncbi:putative integral membrane protein [Cryptosporidium felis]|nr:putative integral membrane protein [Cryptosporidium felis]
MVSIVSTAQANLINEDVYKKRQFYHNNRTCGTWGTAFCCLNLKNSVIVISITYGIIYLFLRTGIFSLSLFLQANKQIDMEYIFQPIQNISSIINGKYLAKIFGEVDFLGTVLNCLKISCFISSIVFVIGLLTGILGWLWLTASLMGILWIDAIKSIAFVIYITYLIQFILNTWYMRTFIILISTTYLIIMYLFSYYTIQIVYSLYLVQLAGGRGDEYLAYFKLRRLYQTHITAQTNQNSNSLLTERDILENTSENNSLIRINQDLQHNV